MAAPFLPLAQFLAAFFSLTPAEAPPTKPISVLANPCTAGKPPVLRMRGMKAQPLEVRLCDRLGRPIMVHPCTPTSVDFKLVLPLPEHLAPGMYLITVDTVTQDKPVELWIALDGSQRPLASR